MQGLLLLRALELSRTKREDDANGVLNFCCAIVPDDGKHSSNGENKVKHRLRHAALFFSEVMTLKLRYRYSSFLSSSVQEVLLGDVSLVTIELPIWNKTVLCRTVAILTHFAIHIQHNRQPHRLR